MSNPFVFGVPVTGEGFVDRELELERLIEEMGEQRKVFLVSPRRYGKTSLLTTLALALEARGHLVAIIDLYKADCAEELLSLMSTTLLSRFERRVDKAARVLKELVPSLRPRLDLSSDGTPSLTVDVASNRSDLFAMADKVLDLPEVLAQRSKKPCTVLFDEFQEVGSYRGGWEHKLRAAMQHHRHVGYVFSGSREHMLRRMVEDASRPFYQMGALMTLPPVPRAAFTEHLVDGFVRGGMTLSERLAHRLMDFANDYPHNIQHLAYMLYNQVRGRPTIDEADLDMALATILHGHEPVYQALWNRLTTLQRKVARAVAAQGSEGIFAKAVRDEHGLGPASTVGTNLEALEKKEVLRRNGSSGFAFVDPFFRAWLQRLI